MLSAEDEDGFREHVARADELAQKAFMALREAQNMHKKALSEVASIVDMIVQEDLYEMKIRHEWRAREAKVK